MSQLPGDPRGAVPPLPENGSSPVDDVSFRGLILATSVVVALTVLALIASGWLYALLDPMEGEEARDHPSLEAPRSEPPMPRLQVSPLDDLGKLRAEEDAILGTYGWDRESGLFRIPIERAMEVLAAEGIPPTEEPRSK
ncbi:MAG TPA: hypothetical protein VMT52_00220 [Planctomycetota bacterium]|nr:hypothetical protein [Planctomycetota bacterium]